MQQRRGVLCTPLRQPLPPNTLLELCDRSGAALRRQLAEVATSLVAGCGGRLPRITRRYLMPDDDDGPAGDNLQDDDELCELMCADVPVSEWLWSALGCNCRSRRTLTARSDGRRSEGDLRVIEVM
jgi:hypothetical protein